MALLKNAKFFLKLAWARLFGKRFPLTVIFNVTNRCNSLCKHCYASYYMRDASGEMSTTQAKQILLDLHRHGCERISFSGGEPLLRKDLFELADYVNNLGMSAVLNTNGMDIPRHLENLKKFDAVAVSLEGRPEHHDIIRGAGTAARTLQGIEAAVKTGLCVHTNTVLNKLNLHDIDYILDLASRWGFKAEFALFISNIFGESKATENLKPSNEEYRKALGDLIQKKKEGAPILFSSDAYESVLHSWKDFAVEGIRGEAPPPGMPECPAAKLFCLIDADGTLWACPHLIGKIEAQNVLKSGVTAAWKTAAKHPCRGCYQVYHHEFGMLMNLKPGVIFNYIRGLFLR